jgi:hypothetical protein
MTEQQEKAMRMALEALEAHADIGIKSDRQIEALRTALAQPEQEPVAWIVESKHGNWAPYIEWSEPSYLETQVVTALYTAPPQKEWIGLPDEKEILEMSKDAWGRALLNYGRDDHCSFYVAFARAIETYLKEKNHG